MKVYVVTGFEEKADWVYGVYSTEEKAKENVKKLKQVSFQNNIPIYAEYTEFTLDDVNEDMEVTVY